MSTRGRIIAAQAATVAALVLVVYLTLLRQDSGTPLPDIQAPGGVQVQEPPGPNNGDRGKGKKHRGRGERGKGDNASPGLGGPLGTGTIIVGGPGWMGSFPAPPTQTVNVSPPTDQYADSVARLLGKVGEQDPQDGDGTTPSMSP